MEMLDVKNSTGPAATPEPLVETEEKIKYGPAAAAFLAAGIGTLGYSLLIVMVEASKGFKTFMTLNNDVGPLSGKTIGAVLIWLVAWAVLHFTLRNREVDFRKYFIAASVLVLVGLIIIFPPVYQMFTVK
jgi:hypothetical protein